MICCRALRWLCACTRSMTTPSTGAQLRATISRSGVAACRVVGKQLVSVSAMCPRGRAQQTSRTQLTLCMPPGCDKPYVKSGLLDSVCTRLAPPRVHHRVQPPPLLCCWRAGLHKDTLHDARVEFSTACIKQHWLHALLECLLQVLALLTICMPWVLNALLIVVPFCMHT
jgi:hypothetical protein